MTDNYDKELIQIAAVCLAAAQVDLYDTSDLSEPENMLRAQKLLNDVLAERQAQEVKWGERKREDSKPEHWLTILLEEVGEWAAEIKERYRGNNEVLTGHSRRVKELGLISPALKLGVAARLILEWKEESRPRILIQ